MHGNFDLSLPDKIDYPKLSLQERVVGKIKRTLRLEKPPALHEARGWPMLPYQAAELVFWRPTDGVNFGDDLGRTIVELMLAREGFTIFDEVRKPRALLSVGSILAYANDNDVVWGSGVNGSVPAWRHTYSNLDVRAVRGPLTRQFLMERGITVPEVYGDPGLLVKRLTKTRFDSPRSGVALVPNLHDMGLIQSENLLKDFPEVRLINPLRAWNTVVEEITRLEFVVASSLHGLIIAEAYGIPACYVRLSEHEGKFKYEDYYEGTGRRLEYVTSVGEALAKGGAAPINFDYAALERAFPYDIWQ